MRAVIQRVSGASVDVEGQQLAGSAWVAGLAGRRPGDPEDDAAWLADKI